MELSDDDLEPYKNLDEKDFESGSDKEIPDNLLANDAEIQERQEYLVLRHRLDIAKLLLGKDGGYSLRKFKKIFKREMEENPDIYVVLNDQYLKNSKKPKKF